MMSSIRSTLDSTGRGKSLAVIGIQVAIVGTLLAIWELFPDLLFDETLVGRPSLILTQTIEWLRDGVLLEAAAATLKVVFLGLLYGGAGGIALGLAAALWRPLELLVEPTISVLFALPKSAFMPLFILWFGVSARQHTIFTATVVFFFFFFATFNGVRAVPNALRSMLAIYGAKPWQSAYLLYLPASFSWLLAGVRLAMPQAFLAAITSEIIASREGLGHLVKANAAVMNPSGMFAALLCLVLISVALSGTVLFLGQRSRWQV
jgi:NitT/TauT family transport system permease protein